MSTHINPSELSEIGLHFYRYVEHHIEELEKNYLLEMPELPFVHYCFELFIDHYRTIYALTHYIN